jgi:hypothetical protein
VRLAVVSVPRHDRLALIGEPDRHDVDTCCGDRTATGVDD